MRLFYNAIFVLLCDKSTSKAPVKKFERLSAQPCLPELLCPPHLPCRPLLHALMSHGIANGFGIELDSVKCAKAEAFLKQTLQAVVSKGCLVPSVQAPAIRCCPIESIATLNPATHAYSFWEGVPLVGKAAFGQLFAASKTLKVGATPASQCYAACKTVLL